MGIRTGNNIVAIGGRERLEDDIKKLKAIADAMLAQRKTAEAKANSEQGKLLDSEEFRAACSKAGTLPTKRQARKFLKRKGLAYRSGT